MSGWTRKGSNLYDPVTNVLVGFVDLNGVEQIGVGGGGGGGGIASIAAAPDKDTVDLSGNTSIALIAASVAAKADATATAAAIAAKLSPTGVKTINGQSIIGTGDVTISGGGATSTRVAATNAIPLDSTSGKAMPLTPGQAIQITSATVVTVASGAVDGGVCVADYEVSSTLDLSACIASGATPSSGYRYRVTYEYSQLEGKPYAYVVQGSALPSAVPGAPTLAAGTAAATTQPLTITPPTVDGTHGTAVAYAVAQSNDGGTTWSQVYSGSSLTLTISGLTEQTSYQFRATATNATGTGPVSNIVTATTAANTTPVLEWVTPTAVSTRDLSAAKDYVLLGVATDTSAGSSHYIRKLGAGLLTSATAVSFAGVYGNLGETWTATNAIDETHSSATAFSQNACSGYTLGSSETTAWGITAPALTNERDVLGILCGIYTTGWTLHATLSDGSATVADLALPVSNNVLRGIRFRGGTAGATVRLELRGPSGQGTGVVGVYLVAG